MNEKEKMITGHLYRADGEELERERAYAKSMCFRFNAVDPINLEQGNAILRELFGRVAGSFTINQPFWCDYGYNIELGHNFYANHILTILDPAPVVFGDNVFLGPNCGFYTAGHPLDREERNSGLEYAYPITVGNNVWMGGGVIVLPGVEIGDDVVIAAGSVVNKNIPAGVIAAGNPCRVVREIRPEDAGRYKRLR